MSGLRTASSAAKYHSNRCSGVAVQLDRKWDGGFTVTLTSQPWRPRLPLQLTLPPPGATLESFAHANLHAAHPTGVSVIAAEQPGVSLGGHVGARLDFTGEWRGATARCGEACAAAAVFLVSGAEHAHGHEHGHEHGVEGKGHGHEHSGGDGKAHEHGGGDGTSHAHAYASLPGGVLTWRVSPAAWSPKALVTLHTSEPVKLLRIAHATLVDSSSGQLWQVVLDDSADDHGAFEVDVETVDGHPLSSIPFTSCMHETVSQPPSAPPAPPSAPDGDSSYSYDPQCTDDPSFRDQDGDECAGYWRQPEYQCGHERYEEVCTRCCATCAKTPNCRRLAAAKAPSEIQARPAAPYSTHVGGLSPEEKLGAVTMFAGLLLALAAGGSLLRWNLRARARGGKKRVRGWGSDHMPLRADEC